MAVGTVGKRLMSPVLVVNLLAYLILLGLAGWSLDKYINGQKNHPHLGGNSATTFMLIFALIAGVIGASSVLAGFMHLRAWRSDSLASAASSATIAWALTALAFGLACKEIKLGGMRGRRLKILEAFIIISTVFQLIYVGLLHAGIYNRRYGPGYYDYGGAEYGVAGHEPQKTTAPPAAV